MEFNRRLIRLSGVLLIVLFVMSAVAAGLAGSVGDYNIPPGKIGGLLEAIAKNQEMHMAEIGFDFLSYVVTAALASVLFVVFSSDGRLLALLGTVGLVSGAVILAAHDIPHFVLPWIADSYVSAGADAVTFAHLGNVTLMTAMWGLSVGVTFLGLGFATYGALLVKGKRVPLIFGWVGIVSGLFLSGGVWLPRYDESLYSLFVMLASPLGLWQLALGVWLLAKGIRHDGSLTPINKEPSNQSLQGTR